jgi:hypothetical protein
MFEGSLDLDTSGGPFDTGFLRITIDGSQQSPGVIPAIGAGDRGSHGFNWQSKPLTPHILPQSHGAPILAVSSASTLGR